MKISVASRAHRCLKGLLTYTPFGDANLEARFGSLIQEIAFLPGDSIVGVYENFPGQKTELIVFTEHFLYFCSLEQWIEIEWAEITSIELSSYQKDFKSTIVAIVLRWGQENQVYLSVRGEEVEGNGRDIFSVLRFIMRVTSDSARAKLIRP